MSEQPALFPGLEAPDTPVHRRHADMLRIYGRCEGRKCGECRSFVCEAYRSRTFFKCELAGITRSAASDWRKYFEACGKFGEGT